MAHKVMDQQLENIVPNHGTRIISHWLNEHSTINQLTSPCTHTQRRVVLWLTFTSRDHAYTHTHCAVTSIFPIKHPKTDQTSSLTKQPSLCCPKRLIKRSSLDFKTDQCWSPSKGRYAMTNIIIILPSLCCHYRRLNIEPHSINDTQPSYHARTHSQSIVVANVSRVLWFTHALLCC